MPRRHTLQPQQIRDYLGIKTDQISRPPSPFKNILPDNNEKKTENASAKESDGGRYLHKKFKKVATLDETPVVAACGDEDKTTPPEDTTVVQSQARYVCPYCALSCSKPSVLQKHIRAHTNERPYPCRPCGFAFKTKSNLYKHCRSRAHTLKMDVTECSSPNPSSEEDESHHISCGEESDRLNHKKIYKPKFHTLLSEQLNTQCDSNDDRESSPSPDNSAIRHKINRLICDSDSALSEDTAQCYSSQVDSPQIATTFPSKLAQALLRPSEPQPLNLSQKDPSVTHLRDSLTTSLNGYKDNGIGVECPDCNLIVDKLDIHLRVGCKAQLESNLPGRHNLPPVGRLLEPGISRVQSRKGPYFCRIIEPCHSPPPFKDLDLPISQHLEAAGLRAQPLKPQEEDIGRHTDLPPVAQLLEPGLSTRAQPLEPRVQRKDTGPTLGRTSLVEPPEKRRKVSPKPILPDLIPTMESPNKSLRLFGGQVKILDGPGGERTLRIESGHESPRQEVNYDSTSDRHVLTISKQGLHSVGLTVVQSESKNQIDSNVNGKISIPILSNIPRNIDPLTTINAYNPLTLPPRMDLVEPVAIVHGGKVIPHVPGIPGPNSLLEPSCLLRQPLSTSSPCNTVCANNPEEPGEPMFIRKPKKLSITSRLSPVEQPVSVSLSTQTSTTTTLSSSKSSDASEKKFVRPTWLPLKAGTFVAKKSLGALGLGPPPVALVSPETPRPRKSYGQLYLNGHAYTYLGLKCSSRMFFCTLNKPQPIYVPLSPEHATLSMYSNWKVVSESALSPLGLSPVCVMSSYDSRNRSCSFSQAGTVKYQVKHSSYGNNNFSSPTSTVSTPSIAQSKESVKEINSGVSEEEDPKRLKICNGGYESTEDYVYIRGRGRGRYVCESCGVRCSKPSMLKKHIRTTHSHLRPYSCKYCSFSFKTKGNLTKHMKSKGHYKQCIDLDVNPVPTTVDSSNIDQISLAKQNALCKELSGCGDDGSSEETEEEDEEDHSTSDDWKSNRDGVSSLDGASVIRHEALLQETKLSIPQEGASNERAEGQGAREHEAAASLLSLSKVAQESALQDYVNLGLISNSSKTYPYTTYSINTTTTTSTSSISSSVIRNKSISISSDETDDECSQSEPLELTNNSSAGVSSAPSTSGLSPTPTHLDTAIDLSNKHHNDVALPKSMLFGEEGILSPVCHVLPSPLGTPSVISDEGCALMTVYLKEKAARDTLIKQQHYRHNSNSNLRLSLSEDRRQSGSPSLVNSRESPVAVDCRSVIDSRPIANQAIESRTVIESRNHVESRSVIDSRVENRTIIDSRIAIDSRNTIENRSIIDSRSSIDNRPLIDSRPVIDSRTEYENHPIIRPVESRLLLDTSRTVEQSDDSRYEDSYYRERTESESDHMEIDVESTDQDKKIEEGVVVNSSAKESALGILALTSSQAQSNNKTSSLLHHGQSKLKAEFLPPSSANNYMTVLEEGKSVCGICQKVFNKPSQLRLHVNIHYFERPFRCDSCGVSFRTKGHLQKHQRSISHLTKVNMNSTFGTATMSNPRPFKCTDCKIAFRIHGHLAKHLRSKMHIMRLECLGKLPFGMYAELERCGLNIHDIDTTDCHNSLSSLQLLAQKLHEKDPSKLGQWAAPVESGEMSGSGDMVSPGETSSDEDEPQLQTITR